MRGVTFALDAGRCLGVAGPNASGKSSLLGTIAGWHARTQGTVTIGGRPAPAHRVPPEVGIATQEVTLYHRLSVAENLRLFGFMHGLREPDLGGRVEEMIDRFDLRRWADRRAGRLSGGVARRLHLALAFIHRPRLLLLDEPTATLDPEARELVLQEVRSLIANGTAVVITSQDLGDVEIVADEILVMVDGEQRLLEPTDQLVERTATGLIEIELGELDGHAPPSLDGVADLTSWSYEDGLLRAEARRPSHVLAAVMSRLERDGLTPVRVEVRPPSLRQLLRQIAPGR